MSLSGGTRGGGRHHPLTGGARGAPAPVVAVPGVAVPSAAPPSAAPPSAVPPSAGPPSAGPPSAVPPSVITPGVEIRGMEIRGVQIQDIAAPQAPPPSVLVMSHSHPRLTNGGAEISAYALYRGLKARGASAWFLGCGTHDAPARLGAPLSQPFGPDDYLYSSGAPFDYFKFANRDPHFPGALTELIQTLRPDIVHAHHYARFGVEMFAVIKRASPGTRIVLSLHEYLAICHHLGQMVKTGSQRLCDSASPGACARCFGDIPAADFFLRQRYIERFFAEVDIFLAPSHFLADRYEAWGIPAARIRVLENMPPERAAAGNTVTVPLETLPLRAAMAPGAAGPASARQRAALTGSSRATKDLRVTNALVSLKRNRPLRFGFFGQMSPLKGIGVLIEAVRRLETMQVGHYSLVIYGDYSSQPEEFQNFVTAALADAPHAISFMGPYRNSDVARLMQRVDAVLVPSIWWENSPVVIQEAFASQRPVICSNIGGMAEKVRHGIDGLHFEVGRPESLARVLANLIEHPEILAELAASLARPLDQAAALGTHIELYRGLLA